MIITELSVYKGDTYCLIVDGCKRTYINISIVERFGLHEGDEITDDTFTKVLQHSEFRKASRRAMYLINEREYSRLGLLEKLRRNYPEDTCQKVLDIMVRKGYVNDRRFAEGLVYNYSEVKLFGPKRVRQELYRRGIRDGTADEALEECYIGMDKRIHTLIEKKYLRYLTDTEDRNAVLKLKNALARAGYDYDDIDRAVKEYLEQGGF